jgi:hypothetical protein
MRAGALSAEEAAQMESYIRDLIEIA